MGTKMYIVNFVNYGNVSSGESDLLELFTSKKEALVFMLEVFKYNIIEVDDRLIKVGNKTEINDEDSIVMGNVYFINNETTCSVGLESEFEFNIKEKEIKNESLIEFISLDKNEEEELLDKKIETLKNEIMKFNTAPKLDL